MRSEEPTVWEATRWILSPKDFVTSRLCALHEPVTDALTSFELVDDSGAYAPKLIAGFEDRLPRIERFDAAIGA